MNVIITDTYKFNEKLYQDGKYIGVGNPKALREEVARRASTMSKEELLEYYIEAETDRAYGFKTKE
jgi:hypothetical protein